MRKATNSTVMREKNEKMILSIINRKPVSRVEIARMTGLTKAAVTIITDDLIKRGFVKEKEGTTDKVGRKPVELYIDGDSVYTIGVNISRYDVTVGIVDISGRVVSEKSFKIGNPSETLDHIKAVAEKLIENSGIDRSKIYKIGIATPGPVDTKKGIILNPPSFNEWHNIAVKEEAEKRMNFEAVVENVSNATAIAEQYFGVARNTANFIALRVDEGIGSGIVTDNRLFGGISEIGHISIKYDGALCECGNRGCLEKYAAIPAILENTPYNTWQEAVDNDDRDIIEREAEYLSAAIITANNIFDLDMAVISGSLTYKAEMLIGKIGEKLCGRVLAKKQLEVYAGEIMSKTIIAASVAVKSFFGS